MWSAETHAYYGPMHSASHLLALVVILSLMMPKQPTLSCPREVEFIEVVSVSTIGGGKERRGLLNFRELCGDGSTVSTLPHKRKQLCLPMNLSSLVRPAFRLNPLSRGLA
jgi:hypothetical protein